MFVEKRHPSGAKEIVLGADIASSSRLGELNVDRGRSCYEKSVSREDLDEIPILASPRTSLKLIDEALVCELVHREEFEMDLSMGVLCLTRNGIKRWKNFL